MRGTRERIAVWHSLRARTHKESSRFALQTDADSEDQLGALISPKATEQERNAAFNFDPSCAFRLRGCQAVCQLMPAVWRELLTRLDTKQLSIIEEQVNNRSCFLQKQD
jgi:hypothetical protein